jgi:excisionase family DNA binding protein
MSTEIMTIKELATYLDMKEQTVYKLAQRGALPGLKLGGSWRFHRDHIERMFDKILSEKMAEVIKN